MFARINNNGCNFYDINFGNRFNRSEFLKFDKYTYFVCIQIEKPISEYKDMRFEEMLGSYV